MAKGLLVAAAAVALVLIAVGAGLYATLADGDSPEGVVTKYYKAYDRGDCDAAADYWRLGRNREAYLTYCESVGDLDVVSLDITDVRRERGRAEVFFTVVSRQDDGFEETTEDSLLLVDEDGTWRIDPRGRYG